MADLAAVTAGNLVCQGENPLSAYHGGIFSQGTSLSWHSGDIRLLLEQKWCSSLTGISMDSGVGLAFSFRHASASTVPVHVVT